MHARVVQVRERGRAKLLLRESSPPWSGSPGAPSAFPLTRCLDYPGENRACMVCDFVTLVKV
jgi:hypothetical protein